MDHPGGGADGDAQPAGAGDGLDEPEQDAVRLLGDGRRPRRAVDQRVKGGVGPAELDVGVPSIVPEITPVGLDDAPRVLQEMNEGRHRGRAVITFE